MGFTTVTEYAVPGGRLDMVWLWDPPSPIPGVAGAIPIAGFEIESSWRTGKHVKGDLLNLQDAGVALGNCEHVADTFLTSPAAAPRSLKRNPAVEKTM